MSPPNHIIEIFVPRNTDMKTRMELKEYLEKNGYHGREDSYTHKITSFEEYNVFKDPKDVWGGQNNYTLNVYMNSALVYEFSNIGYGIPVNNFLLKEKLKELI